MKDTFVRGSNGSDEGDVPETTCNRDRANSQRRYSQRRMDHSSWSPKRPLSNPFLPRIFPVLESSTSTQVPCTHGAAE